MSVAPLRQSRLCSALSSRARAESGGTGAISTTGLSRRDNGQTSRGIEAMIDHQRRRFIAHSAALAVVPLFGSTALGLAGNGSWVSRSAASAACDQPDCAGAAEDAQLPPGRHRHRHARQGRGVEEEIRPARQQHLRLRDDAPDGRQQGHRHRLRRHAERPAPASTRSRPRRPASTCSARSRWRSPSSAASR